MIQINSHELYQISLEDWTGLGILDRWICPSRLTCIPTRSRSGNSRRWQQSAVFGKGAGGQRSPGIKELHDRIGQLALRNDFLFRAGVRQNAVAERKAMIERTHRLSVAARSLPDLSDRSGQGGSARPVF